MDDEPILNNSIKTEFMSSSSQKIGKPFRVGNLNHQYFQSSNGHLIHTSRQIFQKIDTANETKQDRAPGIKKYFN